MLDPKQLDWTDGLLGALITLAIYIAAKFKEWKQSLIAKAKTLVEGKAVTELVEDIDERVYKLRDDHEAMRLRMAIFEERHIHKMERIEAIERSVHEVKEALKEQTKMLLQIISQRR